MVQGSGFVIRVGFILTFDGRGWLGGVSYFRNLLTALVSLPRPRIAPVIIVGTETNEAFSDQFPTVPLIRSALLDWRSPAWVVRRITAELIGRDIGLEKILRQHSIQALSHQGFFGDVGAIPILGWIPDFQEHHLPQFFSRAELHARSKKRSLFCRICSILIVSSSDAKHDLDELDPQCAKKARVLHFVANMKVPRQEDVVGAISRLRVKTPYFYLPNQFWQHKNHAVVIDALRILKDRGTCASVVASGNALDPRQPGHFKDLMTRVKQAKVADRFHTVGVISYSEVSALMASSLAVINPSLFEGWSTTVEETKSMGKAILLSDIPVHREQAPERGRYFFPHCAEDLAHLMKEALAGYDPVVDQQHMQAAQKTLPARLQTFAREYEDIVLEQMG